MLKKSLHFPRYFIRKLNHFFGLCITFLMTAIILCNWQEWSVELKIIAAVSALVPIHVVEEWVFPGGFHYQYNSFWHSDQLDRYPMCRLSDMYTNLIATFMYAGFTLYSAMEGEVPTGITVGTIGFCALEIIIHTMFGIQMYQHFRSKGKQTIYGPGSITAYFGFGVFGVILCYQMVGRTITVTDWIVAVLVVFVGVGIICVLGPENIIKKRDNDYAFHQLVISSVSRNKEKRHSEINLDAARQIGIHLSCFLIIGMIISDLSICKGTHFL